MAYTLKITVVPSGSSGGVVVNPKTYTYVSPGTVSFPGPTQVILRAQAPNIPFDHWEGDLGTFDTAEISFYMNRDISMTAYFNEVPPTQYTLRTTVTPAAGGVIDPVGSMKVNEYTMFPVRLRLAAGYTFVRWSGKESRDTTESNPQYQTIHVYMNHDRNITAVVQYSGGGGDGGDGGDGGEPPPSEFAINLSMEGSGRITKSPDRSTYPVGTQVRLEAIPNSGYEFATWAIDYSGTMNPILLTMPDRNVNLRAVFAAIEVAEWHELAVKTFTVNRTLLGTWVELATAQAHLALLVSEAGWFELASAQAHLNRRIPSGNGNGEPPGDGDGNGEEPPEPGEGMDIKTAALVGGGAGLILLALTQGKKKPEKK